MKTLTNHTLVYDSECPMCAVGSDLLVKTGILEAKGRQSFAKIRKEGLAHVDWTRAQTEIALIDEKDQSVTYGLDSHLKIMETNFPVVKVFRWAPLYGLLRHIYYLISYNRKAIAPGHVFEGYQSCAPAMSYAYRIAYVLLAWLLTSLILVSYFELGAPVVPASGFAREFMVCAGQLVFQGLIVGMFRKERVIHYLGNVMTVSLAGALALTPAFLLTPWISSPWVYVGYFMVVVAFMFFEHKRRVRILELPVVVSYT